MADDEDQQHDPRPGDRPGDRGGWHGAWAVLLPALTFLAGIGLGVGVTLLSDTGGESEAEPTTPPAPSASAGAGDTVVTVPAACEDAAENLSEATRLLDDVAGSLRDFQPQELVDLLDRLEVLDQETRSLAAQCSKVSVSEQASPTDAATSSPSAEDSVEDSDSP